MTDSYVYLIREQDWSSDQFLDTDPTELGDTFKEHRDFQQAVEALGARVTGGAALQSAQYGGVVTPGEGDRKAEDAVYTDSPYADSSELITGFYMVETDDADLARKIAALVPTGNLVEWRKVFPTG